MRHHATAGFCDAYDALPAAVRDAADCDFALLKSDPRHPSLHFKQVGRFWSARVGRSYRASAVQDGSGFAWF